MITILFLQSITVLFYLSLLNYKHLFNNMFWVVCVGVGAAMIPNFATSLYLNKQFISNESSQWLFSITGSLAITFLWYLLKDVKPTSK